MRIQWSALLLLFACQQRFVIEPPPTDGARSLVLVAVDGPSSPIYAADLAIDPAPVFRFDAPAAVELFALGYDASLEELQLGDHTSNSSDEGRPFPATDLVFHLDRDGGALAWSPADAERLAELRLDAYDFEACAAAHGCLRDAEDELCTIPCPTGEAPAAPMIERPDPPAIALLDCGPFEAQRWGDASCAPIGRACTDWPDVPGAIYVRSGANGDGSMAAPFGTVAAALAAVSPGGVVALHGNFAESVRLTAGVTLAGACAAETSIAALDVVGVGTSARDLSIAATSSSAVVLRRGSSIDLEGVVISGGLTGIDAREATITARGIAVKNTGDRALELRDRTTARFEDVVMEHCGGIRVVDGELTLIDAVLRDVARPANGGQAAFLALGSRVGLERVRIARSEASGMILNNGSSGMLTDVAIGDPLPPIGDRQDGLWIIESSAVVDRLVIDQTYDHTLVVDDASTATVSHAYLRPPPADPDTTRTVIVSNSFLSMRSSEIVDTERVAFTVRALATIRLEDIYVHGDSSIGIECSNSVIGLSRVKLEVAGLALRVANISMASVSDVAMTAGDGLLLGEAIMDVRRFSVDASGTAIDIEPLNQLTISEGTLHGGIIGALLPVEFELSRLLRQVQLDGPIQRY